MKNLILKVDIKDSRLHLLLQNGRIAVDQLDLPVNRDLDHQLIGGLDKLFKRNKLIRSGLRSVEISGNIDKNSTFYRIILAFKKGLLTTK